MQPIFDSYGWEVLRTNTLQQGLINQTYVVETTTGNYILQSVNHEIFKDPAKIDCNINLMSSYLKKQYPAYLFTHLIQNKVGETLLEWNGQFYRAFVKIDAIALDVLSNNNQVEEAAAAFSKFTFLLEHFSVQQLQLTIPDFHNLNLRYFQFEKALLHGDQNRINESKEAIQYLISHQKWVKTYAAFIQNKACIQRVTHHDTKISNVLFDKEKAVAIIDLDTTMPGYFISDVGDMCRTYLCPVTEEETDFNRIKILPERWDALQKGYLSHMKETLTNFEIDHFAYAGQFMIYMQALRFLTDHLNRDVYYGAKYEGQNWMRAQNQIVLLDAFNQLVA